MEETEEEINKRLFQEAHDMFGENFQMDMTIEECSELIEAIQHYKRGLVDIDKVIKEMADVQVMLYQMKLSLRIGKQRWKDKMIEKFVHLDEVIQRAKAKAKQRAKDMRPGWKK